MPGKGCSVSEHAVGSDEAEGGAEGSAEGAAEEEEEEEDEEEAKEEEAEAKEGEDTMTWCMIVSSAWRMTGSESLMAWRRGLSGDL